jgi:hypothetical protein
MKRNVTTPFAPKFGHVPPHPNAAAHVRVMARLERMTPQEVFQHAVEVGIYTPRGQLMPSYGGPSRPVYEVVEQGRFVPSRVFTDRAPAAAWAERLAQQTGKTYQVVTGS